jgi:hypothetical protein
MTRLKSRATLREPHPVRAGAVACGAFAGGVWLITFGSLSITLRGYLLWTAFAGATAWLTSLALARSGDRGVAVGVAAATGVAWSVAAVVLLAQWYRLGVWPV